MARSFNELRKKMSPESRQRATLRTKALMAEMRLAEVRQARKLSQERLAELLKMKQPSVSKLERRTDMYISSLRNFIEALGGELEIIAHFDGGEVRITQFADLAEDSDARNEDG